ncbi:MAG: RimK family alpha-L-glutamate ligase [Clostridia bacterium]|nr:RimK family alpha-L-glutamate ligase [Clostridia bacterium]
MIKGLIIINGYSTLSSSINQAKRLEEEFKKLGVEITILKNDALLCSIKNSNIDCAIKNCDFCIYLDKDKYVSKMLESVGIRLFNSHESIRVCDDKMETYIALSSKGIPIVNTLPAPLCYTSDATVSKNLLDKVESEIGYPVIVKNSYGSLGSGVFKADNRQELEKIANNLISTPHLFQQFIKESSGIDTRVIVIGGKVVASMERRSLIDFRSNIELGGTGVKVELDESFKKVAEKTAKTLNLDYCGIDLLHSRGGAVVCEVNSNAFFGGIESVTKVNVAKAYAEYILSEIKS